MMPRRVALTVIAAGIAAAATIFGMAFLSPAAQVGLALAAVTAALALRLWPR